MVEKTAEVGDHSMKKMTFGSPISTSLVAICGKRLCGFGEKMEKMKNWVEVPFKEADRENVSFDFKGKKVTMKEKTDWKMG